MELATALVWTLRIVLPIILFCIYFKLQAPKDEQYSGSTRNSYTRGKLLAHRKPLEGCPVPEVLSNLALKDATQAPNLFVTSGRGQRGAGGIRKEKRLDPKPREKREASRTETRQSETAEEPEPIGEKAAPSAPLSVSEEKMHLESLLNYVAFNRKEQQRIFLPDDGGAPPPPPPKPRRAGQSAPTIPQDVVGTIQEAAISGATAEKANAEAQMVLRGAINFKRTDVAKDLYNQLVESQVEITERTFTLMIEACVLASDLKSASDFLMKMETSGYCPDSELLDKVMDLYSQQKSQREHEKQREHEREKMLPQMDSLATTDFVPGSMHHPVDNSMLDSAIADATMMGQPPISDDVFQGERAKLSSGAPLFVPSFGGMAPPPPPPQEPIVAGDITMDAQGETPLKRTKLMASAKPFEPQYNVRFDPLYYTWTVDQTEEPGKGDSKGKGKKGKGRGKGKAQQDQSGWEDENEAGWVDEAEEIVVNDAETVTEKKWKPVVKDKEKEKEKEQPKPKAKAQMKKDDVDGGKKKTDTKKKGTPTWKPK